MKKSLLFCFVLLLAGCSKDLDLKKFENKNPDEIFKEGKMAVDSNNYQDAVEIFGEFEKLYPYSKLIPEAQIYEGEGYYKLKKYDESVTAFEIFVKTHPTHEKVPYALYMLGKINFEQMPIIERDQEVTAKSLAYLSELANRYPDSKYLKEAEVIIKKARQHIAGREVYVARYYQSKNNYAAAVGRLNTVADFYSDTDHAPEAFHRLVECYVAMGMFDEARLVNKILQTKFQKTQWANYASDLLNRMSPQTISPKKAK